ncbi:MAG: phosphopyruvate hydratase [Candidatus Chisholmbacteria bacterium RIFCSPHIGHO2_01_FULL_48_12]|uniref:Enolase n=1 Tax=Candidatus Chisholmbacteria bacterium RIFCSPHIGHO2_01_FULL_48_12 TaxID=1797589 RepID=A0A1G1VNC8_9BACT|nr:MAG: phosphopyruvate hydratase [Candidatus Chisholmbacteria bacterium RIFCSPHIGHO2_01_FULL_48_12]
MPKIQALKAREILDSRGIPTLETEIWLDSGHSAIASIPSGTSTGKYEAVELRDSDSTRFNGKGVLKAAANVNTVIAPQLVGRDPQSQIEIDQLLINLDGTNNKARLGANATLSVSQAVCEVAAASLNLPTYLYLIWKYRGKDKVDHLPTPIFNLINGGKHGAGNLDFQEFHLIPATTKTFPQSLQIGAEIYQTLEKVLIDRGAIHSVGVEGGFAPNLLTNLDALEALMATIRATPYQFAKDVFLGLDVAASSFFQSGRYTIKDRAQPFSPEEFLSYYEELDKTYHLFSLEDPLQEDDWSGWQALTQLIGQTTLIVGDDLLATNKNRLRQAITKQACTAILVKPNQIGTISETVEVINLARQTNFKVIISHRSGETTDDFIADFAVGLEADYTKFGAPVRGERVAKYNRLLAIESQINP